MSAKDTTRVELQVGTCSVLGKYLDSGRQCPRFKSLFLHCWWCDLEPDLYPGSLCFTSNIAVAGIDLVELCGQKEC